MVTAAGAAGRSGLEFMRAMAGGEIPPPPILHTLGMRLESVAEGEAVFSLEPAEFHYNPIGSVHGGVYATLLDSAAGCAVQTRLPAGTGYTSLDLGVKFLGAIRVGSGTLRCTGRVVHLGRRTALAEARIESADGRLLATATSSCLLLTA
ncbi:PaaI family thioesterase [Streptomyces polygonati]|uniref:PaaI family thioesterase n=1 Tax=Streptomyces polygonati TaxID=1617087 RepID=A0ABV8HWM9_9ACTN